MFLKKNRANKREIEKIFKEGRFLNSPSLTFKFLLKKDLKIRKISFIAPKNAAKLAVRRNLLRRKGYLALKKQLNQFPVGILGTFIFKRYEENVLIIENEIKAILNKIN